MAKPKGTKPAAKPTRLILGQKLFAKHCGVTTKTVQNWQEDDLPFTVRADGVYEYDLDQTEPWLETFRESSNSDPDGIATRKKRDLVRLDIESEQLARIRRENAEADGNILPKDEYELHLVERNQLVRDSFLNISKQMRKHVCASCAKKLNELDKLINKALHQLADKGHEE